MASGKVRLVALGARLVPVTCITCGARLALPPCRRQAVVWHCPEHRPKATMALAA